MYVPPRKLEKLFVDLVFLSLLWAISGPLLGTYSIVKNLNVPLIVQPQVFSALTLCSWAQVNQQLLTCFTLWLIFILVSILREQTPLVCGASHVYISLARLRGLRGRNDLRCKGKKKSLVRHAMSDSIDLFCITQPSFEAGNGRPIQFFGIFSSVLLSTALL